MAPAVHPILRAEILSCDLCRPDGNNYATSMLQFRVPLRHHQPIIVGIDSSVVLTAFMVHAETSSEEDPIRSMDWSCRFREDDSLRLAPILLYLCGGPGADNPPHRNVPMNQWLLNQGYSILYLDYRGCGQSTPVCAKGKLRELGQAEGDRGIADYITHFCQDNIVRDLEAIRLCFARMLSRSSLKWTILGQSYGGYISLTYLSMHPSGLEEVFITGGLPPCGMDIKDYFRIEYRDIVAQNEKFYAEYPDAHTLVRTVLGLIKTIGPTNIRMSGRGYLSGHKLLTLGRQFGSKVGFPEVYDFLTEIKENLEDKTLSPKVIRKFESILHVDERPLYPLLLEQTWCSGGKTRWAAEQVAREIEGFEYLRADENGTYPDPADMPADKRVYFTANTYCRFHYDTHEELVDLKGAAELLAEHDWEDPYDYKMLAENSQNVPVYAISFDQDMHLDVGVAAETAAKVGGLKLVVDPGWHQDIRYRPAEVLENLFRVRETAQKDGSDSKKVCD